MYPRVLVISNNPFSETSNNGKTYASFFKGWPKEKLAQLYFTNEVPLDTICGNYFNFEQGYKIETNTSNLSSKQSFKQRIYLKMRDNSLASLLFNHLWDLKIKKYEKHIYEFVKIFEPDVIFFVGGRRNFTYKTTNLIADKFNIPIYLYYTDDYFVSENNNFFMKINNYLFLKEAYKTIDKSKSIFVIGNKMKKVYEKKFNKKCIPIMNSINFEEYDLLSFKEPNENLKIAYFGGLHLKRLDSIIDLAKIVDEDNQESKRNTIIDLYSASHLDMMQIDLMNKFDCLCFKGRINANNIISKMNEYDVLLFVESFEQSMINRTHLSLSTKIPEYLAVGKPIFAIGPIQSGSIEYLKEIGLSYVNESNSFDKMKSIYQNLLNDTENFRNINKQSKIYAKLNHSYQKNHDLLRKELSK
ncbi:hypothetical protein [Macrococcus epidermidis]|uniref:hypothetical protein n=1 Tax=Macrococcus epidermidis TaxID=1902580 RepID=UPI0020B692C0|nr:hypothetical protein [Macrococcus epidermidis]UTH15986.1 hypothetical protein KFV12_12035 [Macrococcus epidermidis]